MRDASALPCDLLEAAAGLDPKASVRWAELSLGLEALLPGRGAKMVAHARRACLDPFGLEKLEFAFETTGLPVLWFAAEPGALTQSIATPCGVVSIPARRRP